MFRVVLTVYLVSGFSFLAWFCVERLSLRKKLQHKARLEAASAAQNDPDFQSISVEWSEIAKHQKLGEFLQVAGEDLRGNKFELVFEIDPARKYELTHARYGRTRKTTPVGERSLVSLVQKTTLRMRAGEAQEFELIRIEENARTPEKLPGQYSFELTISNRVNLRTGYSLCASGKFLNLDFGFIKAWDLTAKSAETADLSQTSLEADLALLAHALKVVYRADLVGRSRAENYEVLKPGVCYVLGNWGGPSIAFELNRDVALLVVDTFSPAMDLAAFLRGLSLNPMMHGRIMATTAAGRSSWDPAFVCPEANTGGNSRINLKNSNAIFALKSPRDTLEEILKIEVEDASATRGPIVSLTYLPSPTFQNILLWSLPNSELDSSESRSAPAMESQERSGRNPIQLSKVCLENGSGQSIPLLEGSTLVGRGTGARLFLEESSVSLRHCEIKTESDCIFARDLGSTNGTFCDGKPVGRKFTPISGQLAIGNLRFSVKKVEVSEKIRLLA